MWSPMYCLWNALMLTLANRKESEGTPVDEELGPIAYFEPNQDR